MIFYRFGQILFNLARIFVVHREKSFVPVFLKVCIDGLFDNMGSRKRNYFYFFLIFGTNPLPVGQSYSLYRTEGIRLEIILSIEKKSI